MLYNTSCAKRNNIIKITLNTKNKRVTKSLYDKQHQLIYQQFYFGGSIAQAGELYLSNIQKCVSQGYTVTKVV
ncbi:hypothetical protein EDC18_1092 [Natranaerovirga pectinivora]|uniref:Uncharacterized protein n=1 Tax=Natranaerovirga pectinivora TaxID=682400 RepID=A0A4R3MHE1_9FIRM|nr:hypothetical protein [Natranaerovirga pectinivora]TCT13042.1 hypothetical protein EDC18_1092 [Natranaerovirga pectinivora]